MKEPFPIALDRPLVIFDIESTGISPRADRIIELAAIRIDPDGSEHRRCWLLNPGVPIPQETTAIHGITDEAVANQPLFKDKALEILAFFGDSDLAGYNIGRFDIPMLEEEFARVDIRLEVESRRLLDAQRIFHLREPRDLSAALRYYCGREHTDAHGAEADTEATLDVIKGQWRKYGDLPRDMHEVDRQFNAVDPFNADRTGRLRWVDGELTVNFSRKKGAKVKDLVKEDPGFLKWIIKGDFPQDLRQICENVLKGEFPPAPTLKVEPTEK